MVRLATPPWRRGAARAAWRRLGRRPRTPISGPAARPRAPAGAPCAWPAAPEAITIHYQLLNTMKAPDRAT
ncbi:unnamed protein product [Parnassius apollo]|uniref:(apollo) hypothetical protein n=1 Tax=Parnassius apollo TaxID=110799 RepID=A0A8S3XII7_PARAO|nr:unnamed protein product [Parnassius apollo]